MAQEFFILSARGRGKEHWKAARLETLGNPERPFSSREKRVRCDELALALWININAKCRERAFQISSSKT